VRRAPPLRGGPGTGDRRTLAGVGRRGPLGPPPPGVRFQAAAGPAGRAGGPRDRFPGGWSSGSRGVRGMGGGRRGGEAGRKGPAPPGRRGPSRGHATRRRATPRDPHEGGGAADEGRLAPDAGSSGQGAVLPDFSRRLPHGTPHPPRVRRPAGPLRLPEPTVPLDVFLRPSGPPGEGCRPGGASPRGGAETPGPFVGATDPGGAKGVPGRGPRGRVAPRGRTDVRSVRLGGGPFRPPSAGRSPLLFVPLGPKGTKGGRADGFG
jgi:hypothetical protein